MATPKITSTAIKTWLGDTYAQRGLNYFNSGRVTHLRWKGEALTGRVQGSESAPYRVTVTFVGRSLHSDCSCPMGGHCKHVAAVLYAAMSNPSRTSKGPTLEKRLQKLGQRELLELVLALLEEAPELEDFVEMQLMETGAAAETSAGMDDRVRRMVAQLNDYDSDFSLALRGCETVRGRAQALLEARDYEAALNLLHPLISELMLLEPTTFEDDRVFELAQAAAECASQCWPALPPESEPRALALRLVFDVMAWDIHSGGRDIYTPAREALLTHASPDERDQLREWAALAQRAPGMNMAREDDEHESEDYAGEFGDFTRTWAQKEWKTFTQKLGGAARPKKKAARR